MGTCKWSTVFSLMRLSWTAGKSSVGNSIGAAKVREETRGPGNLATCQVTCKMLQTCSLLVSNCQCRSDNVLLAVPKQARGEDRADIDVTSLSLQIPHGNQGIRNNRAEAFIL